MFILFKKKKKITVHSFTTPIHHDATRAQSHNLLLGKGFILAFSHKKKNLKLGAGSVDI